MTRKAGNDNFPQRLLTKSQAAQYCGLAVSTFGAACPVRPIALGNGARMLRYDVWDIDKWIDGFRDVGSSPISKFDELMEKL